MALRCISVMRGTNMPFVVLVISNCAEAFEVAVPMPTDWALLFKCKTTNRPYSIVFFITGVLMSNAFQILFSAMDSLYGFTREIRVTTFA